MVFLVAEVLNCRTKYLLFNTSVEITQPEHIWINFLDVLLYQEASIAPLQNFLGHQFFEIELAPIITKNIPMHDFEEFSLICGYLGTPWAYELLETFLWLWL